LGCYFLNFSTRVLAEPIFGAWPIANDEVIVHYRAGRVARSYRSDTFLVTDVWHCWLHPRPPALFLLRRESAVVFIGGKPIEFKTVPFFADGIAMYTPVVSGNFGHATCELREYAPYLVAYAIADRREFEAILKCYESESCFFKLLGAAFGFAVGQAIAVGDWVRFLKERFSGSELARIVEAAVRAVKCREPLFALDELNLAELVSFFEKDVRDSFLLGISIEKFARIKLEGVAEDFVGTALERDEIVRAFLWSVAHGADFGVHIAKVENLATMGLGDAIQLFEKEVEGWGTVEGAKGTLRFLGSALQMGEFDGLALALAVATRDARRVESLFVMNERLVGESREFMRQHPGTAAAAFLQTAVDVDG
jgi:hypothetical protein